MKHAVATLMRAPGITVREAMILAKFTDDEANTKSMQRKVARSMPMKSKKASVKAADATNASGSKSSADANVPISNITTDGSNCAGWVSSVTGFDDDDANNDELLNWKPPREPAACVPWTDEEERMLLDASKENIELGDTALGRVKRRKMSECKQALRDMSEEEFQDLIAARANRATENECERDGEVGAV